MNQEENSFNIDIEAESQSLSSGFGSDTPLPSEIITVMEDHTIESNAVSVTAYEPPQDNSLIESTPYNAQDVKAVFETRPLQPSDNEALSPSQKYEAIDVQKDLTSSKIEYKEIEELIDSQVLEMSEFESKTNIMPQSSQTYGLDFNVKIDPEQVYEKTQQLESQIQTLQTGVNNMANELNKSWLPNSNRDDFEERPLIEATNLIFENRRDKFSQLPIWS